MYVGGITPLPVRIPAPRHPTPDRRQFWSSCAVIHVFGVVTGLSNLHASNACIQVSWLLGIQIISPTNTWFLVKILKKLGFWEITYLVSMQICSDISLVFVGVFVCCLLLASAISASSVAFMIHCGSPLFMFYNNMVLGVEVSYPSKVRFAAKNQGTAFYFAPPQTTGIS